MARPSKTLLLAAALSLSALAHAALLPKPEGLAVDEAAGPRFSWTPVEGAALYRVAVFDAPDAEGKRPLLAAVWVAGSSYTYGKDAVVAKAGKLGSTRPLPLPAGRKLRVMVAAARQDGADKSDWTGADLSVKAPPQAVPVVVPSATSTPTPTPGAAKPQADAELELDGGEEFKSSPEPAVIDLGEGDGAGAVASAAAGGAVGAAVAGAAAGTEAAGQAGSAAPAAASSASAALPTLDAARALVKAGQADEAEAMFKSLTESEPKNADAWEGLGDSFNARQMKVEALEAYERALKLDKSKKHLRDWIDKNVRR